MPRRRPRRRRKGQQPSGGDGTDHHGSRSGPWRRRGQRRLAQPCRPRRRDGRCLRRRRRHGTGGEPIRLRADVAAAAIRRHVCRVHERARQYRAELRAATRRPALWCARPVALRRCTRPSPYVGRRARRLTGKGATRGAIKGATRGLSGGLSGGIKGRIPERRFRRRPPIDASGREHPPAFFLLSVRNSCFSPRRCASKRPQASARSSESNSRTRGSIFAAAGDFVPFFNELARTPAGAGSRIRVSFITLRYSITPRSQRRMPCWI